MLELENPRRATPWGCDTILLSVGQEDIISILDGQTRLAILVDLVEGHPNLHRWSDAPPLSIPT